MIHDAARPFVTDDTIRRTVAAAIESGAAIAAIGAHDTVKRVNANRPGDGDVAARRDLPCADAAGVSYVGVEGRAGARERCDRRGDAGGAGRARSPACGRRSTESEDHDAGRSRLWPSGYSDCHLPHQRLCESATATTSIVSCRIGPSSWVVSRFRSTRDCSGIPMPTRSATQSRTLCSVQRVPETSVDIFRTTTRRGRARTASSS